MDPSDVNAYDVDEDGKSSQILSENMSKSQHGSKDEKAAQIVEAKPLAKDDTFSVGTKGRGHKYSKVHKFWETQPVVQFKDMGDTSLPEGPIEPATALSKVKQEPYNLHSLFEWTTCDMNSDDMCSKVFKFLEAHYPDDGYNLKVSYSREHLKWALCPPGYQQSWHIGVRVKESKRLVAFISGVPTRIRVRDEVVKMAKINFLCVHKKYRSRGYANVLIKEMSRMVQLQNIWQAVYMSEREIPTPFTICQSYCRLLNPRKLVDVEFTTLRERMTMSMAIKFYKLPDAPITSGFREMERRDVLAVTELLRNYLSQFVVATDFDEDDVGHWLLPREDVVHSYVVESPQTHDVTDFCSFFSLPLTIVGNSKYTTVECAYSHYNVATQTSFPQLMNDSLIVSKQKGFDVFIALDVMHNGDVFKDLKFDKAEGQTYYYLYNYRLSRALEPSKLGLTF